MSTGSSAHVPRRGPAHRAVVLAWLAALAVWGCDGGAAAVPAAPPDGGARRPADAARPPPACALDAECGARLSGALCVDGACVPHPLDPPGCGPLAPCATPMVCGADAHCGCRTDAHCPPGFACGGGGVCVHASAHDECAADADCGDGAVCLAGACLAPVSCGRAPTLPEGGVRLVHQVPVREVVPEALDAVLDALAEPFRVLAGDGLALDLGLPGWVERLVAQLASAWAERHLEPWHRALLGLLADVDDLLAGFCLEEDLLVPAAAAAWPAGVTAERTALRLVLEHEERRLEGSPDDLLGAAFDLPPPRLSAACDHVAVHARSAALPAGALVVWLVDRLVEEASEGRHRDVDSALRALSQGFCEGLAGEVGGAVGLGVGPVIEAACEAELERLRTRELAAVRMATLGVEPVDLRSDTTLDPLTGRADEGRSVVRVGGRALSGRFTLTELGAGAPRSAAR